MSDFHVGKMTVLGWCCNKPLGCTIDSAGCLHKRQKSGDPTVRCQATCWPDAAVYRETPVDQLETWQCKLPQHNTGPCDTEPIGVGAKPKLIVGKYPKREAGNVAMDDDDSRWADAIEEGV